MLWIVPINDKESATKVLKKVITDGIGLNLDFEYSMVDINCIKNLSKWKLQEKKPKFMPNQALSFSIYFCV